jgi:hypothetical protein
MTKNDVERRTRWRRDRGRAMAFGEGVEILLDLNQQE